MAVSHLLDAGEPIDMIASEAGAAGVTARRLVARMIERGTQAPFTSSAGRLFDAMAAVAGVHPRMSFEGQAAMALESLASVPADSGYPHEIDDVDGTFVLDTRPMIRAAAADARRGAGAAVIARRFHRGLAEAICAMCRRLCADTGLTEVVLTGGVFLNAVLTLECERQLTLMGFDVYRHRLVPPGDGGLSLGQLAVAAARGAGKEA